jgi:tetratricopeptide (TPR) repeat protein
VLLFGRELLRVLKEKETDSPLKGGVAVWSRLGTVYQELGDRKKAIQEFREGIDVLTDLSGWKPGNLIGNESDFGVKYSKVEILYAKKGACHLEMGEHDQALSDLNKALDSVNRRGMDDIVTESFPNGIKNLASRAKRGAA